MNNFQLVKLGIAFILLFAFFQPVFAVEELPTPVGKVVWIKGTFKAIMPNQELRILQRGSIIYLHDTLLTEKDSEAQIIFTDNSLMSFRPDTRLYIGQYQYNPRAKSRWKYVMQLIEGGFRTITGLIARQRPNDYQINTPVATIGVRGTDFSIYYRDGQLYIARYAGIPCVGALCLSAAVPYAHVPAPGAAPVPLTERPDVFKMKEEITPVKMEPFSGGGGGGVAGPTTGTVSGFCIQ